MIISNYFIYYQIHCEIYNLISLSRYKLVTESFWVVKAKDHCISSSL